MELTAQAGTHAYRATRNSVALQQSRSYRPTRAHARKAQTGKSCSATANGVAHSRPLPPLAVTVLKHCRCIDCRHWIGPPYSECRYGIIRNGVKDTPDFSADAWHYCARYRGPQISRDVWVWPKAAPRAVQVGAGSNISAESDESTTSAQERDVREPRVNGSFVGT